MGSAPFGRGARTATGRPCSVTSRVSPSFTRRTYTLRFWRSSRIPTLIMTHNVAQFARGSSEARLQPHGRGHAARAASRPGRRAPGCARRGRDGQRGAARARAPPSADRRLDPRRARPPAQPRERLRQRGPRGRRRRRGGRRCPARAPVHLRRNAMTELLVGTKKGLFVLRGEAGDAFDVVHRAFPGDVVEYAMRDARSGRYFASVTSGFYGPRLFFADDPAGEC